MLLSFENLSRILRLEPASQPQNLPAEPQKLERVTPRSSYEDNKCNVYILQTVNTTNKMEMLREKTQKYQAEVNKTVSEVNG